MSDLYAAVEAILEDSSFGVESVCEVLGLTRSAFYAWKSSNPSERERGDEQLAPVVRELFWKHRRRYGTRRLIPDLAERGFECGRRRLAKTLKRQGLMAIQPKSFKPKTTESRHTLGYSPNLLLEGKEPSGINRLWVGDITYIPMTGGSFCYLAMLMDRFSRRIVGYSLANSMTEELVLAALSQAIRQRSIQEGLIHHTDRGGQYAGRQYRTVLRRAAMRQSMSRPDNVYDNAFMESCFGTLKTELEMTEYQTQREALKEIGDYIAYYNLERRHSSLRYLSPHHFELQSLKQP
jgi:transposase InsO family protein